MGIKDTFENHVVGFGLGVFVSGVGLATALVWPLVDRHADNERDRLEVKYTSEIAGLESSLASIEVTATGERRYILVEDMLLDTEEARAVSSELQFFPEDQFFAVALDETGPWTYEETTELALLEETTGYDGEQLREALGLPANASLDALTQVPVHLWKHSETYEIGGFEGLARLAPQVFIQRLRFDSDGDREVDLSDGSVTLDELESLYRGDATAALLTNELYLLEELRAQGQAEVELTSVDKKGNVVYARISIRLHDVTVNGSQLSDFYVDREFVAISSPSSLYVVKTVIPSVEPRSDAALWIAEWLTRLRIAA